MAHQRKLSYTYARQADGSYNIYLLRAGYTVFHPPVVAKVDTWREAEEWIDSAPTVELVESETDTNSKGERLERTNEWPYVQVAKED